jgi:hypothetical protein
LGGCLLRDFLRIKKLKQIWPKFLFYFLQKKYVLILTKTGWVKFWAIFPPNHLVTLSRNKAAIKKKMLLFQKVFIRLGMNVAAKLCRYIP